MTGARIEMEVDTTLVSTALGRALDVLGGDGLTLMLEDMGEYLQTSTQERAAQGVSPAGAKWDALSPRYAARKARKRPGAPILQWDLHMLGDRLTHQVEGTTLLVGTSAKYGAIHQFGGTIHHAALSHVRSRRSFGAHDVTIPPRPWLGVSDDDATELVQIVQDHLRLALDGGTP